MEIGYLSREYADSLEEFGVPVFLRHSGSYILERRIPGTDYWYDYWDGMGLYPLFCCRDWGGLAQDLKGLFHLVSLVVVTDPLYTGGLGMFDRVKPFKTHYVVDGTLEYRPSDHHLRYARKAARDGVEVAFPYHPTDYLPEWLSLYSNLIRHHGITGIRAFSDESFRQQFRVPGLAAFVASYNDEIVCMLLFYRDDDVAYYHLGASSDLGYELKASFALTDYAIQALRPRTIVLGGAAGNTDSEDGLARFKAGWANTTRYSCLCEAVLYPSVYEELGGRGDYFPAYRG